jgi:hypothetical protein
LTAKQAAAVCCVCVALGSWELGAPEDGDWVCGKAILAASKKVADVNKTALFMFPPKSILPGGHPFAKIASPRR